MCVPLLCLCRITPHIWVQSEDATGAPKHKAWKRGRKRIRNERQSVALR